MGNKQPSNMIFFDVGIEVLLKKENLCLFICNTHTAFQNKGSGTGGSTSKFVSMVTWDFPDSSQLEGGGGGGGRGNSNAGWILGEKDVGLRLEGGGLYK